MFNQKIVIVGGRSKADFIIESLLKNNCELVVINDDQEFCDHLAQKHRIPVVFGNTTKLFVYEDAEIEGADALICLLPSDADNYIVCQIAKKLYGIKKTVSIVSNPRNVEVFKKLGIETVISATYTIANIIGKASTINELSEKIENQTNVAQVKEFVITQGNPVLNKKLKSIKFPSNMIVSAIFRNNVMIVPNGDTKILENDKLVVVSNTSLLDNEIENWEIR